MSVQVIMFHWMKRYLKKRKKTRNNILVSSVKKFNLSRFRALLQITDLYVRFAEFTYISRPKPSAIYKMLALDGAARRFRGFHSAVLSNNFRNSAVFKNRYT